MNSIRNIINQPSIIMMRRQYLYKPKNWHSLRISPCKTLINKKESWQCNSMHWKHTKYVVYRFKTVTTFFIFRIKPYIIRICMYVLFSRSFFTLVINFHLYAPWLQSRYEGFAKLGRKWVTRSCYPISKGLPTGEVANSDYAHWAAGV